MHRLCVCFLPSSETCSLCVCAWCWIKEDEGDSWSVTAHPSVLLQRLSVVELVAPERNTSPRAPVTLLLPSVVRELSELSCECGAEHNNVSVCDISWPEFEYEPKLPQWRSESKELRFQGAGMNVMTGKKKVFKATIWQPDVNLHPALICPTTFTNHKLLNRSLPGRRGTSRRLLPRRLIVAAEEQWCSERPEARRCFRDSRRSGWNAGEHEQRGRPEPERFFDVHHRQHPQPEAAGRRRPGRLQGAEEGFPSALRWAVGRPEEARQRIGRDR